MSLSGVCNDPYVIMLNKTQPASKTYFVLAEDSTDLSLFSWYFYESGNIW